MKSKTTNPEDEAIKTLTMELVRRGWSKRDLAKAAGYTPPALAVAWSRKFKKPGIVKLVIEHALGIPIWSTDTAFIHRERCMYNFQPGRDPYRMRPSELRAFCRKNKIKVSGHPSRDHIILKIGEELRKRSDPDDKLPASPWDLERLEARRKATKATK